MINPITLAENGLLPCWLIRFGIRKRLQRKLEIEGRESAHKEAEFLKFIQNEPVAQDAEAANEQHYELPPEFFSTVLGKHLKYSCAIWEGDCPNLDEAEIQSLKQVAERAKLKNGQRILELGCGWGSFTLWAAEKFPDSKFTAVSNSRPQGNFIRTQAKSRNLGNVTVITADMNHFRVDRKFDRIVSIEMFEHMRNYKILMERISNWLRPDGRLFVHIFSHKKYAYSFNAEEKEEWMARYFFTGGIMPSHELLTRFNSNFQVEKSWTISGTHYQKTLEAWLKKFNQNKEKIQQLFRICYGESEADIWMWRWRLFFLACSELFGFRNGKEWGISHYLFMKAN